MKARKVEGEAISGDLSLAEEEEAGEQEVSDVDSSDFEDLSEQDEEEASSERGDVEEEEASEEEASDGEEEAELPAEDGQVSSSGGESKTNAPLSGCSTAASSSDVRDEPPAAATAARLAPSAPAARRKKVTPARTSSSSKNTTRANTSEDDEASSIPSDEDTDNLEYGSDSDDSDDEAEKNRIGDVPLSWYDDEDHVGYDLGGEKIGKSIGKSEIDQLLNKFDNPDAWRTITDVKNQEEIRLSDKDLEAIRRIMQHKVPYASTDMETMVEYDNPAEAIHPTTNRPEGKARFLPSKWEGMKIKKIVRLMREGKIGAPPPPKPEIFDIWRDDVAERRKAPTALIAPKMALPTHAESFNPPEEYLMTEEEQKAWEELDETERPLNFVPQKYGQLRKVPAYPNLIVERFHRCLDLYLVPRALKKRMNVAKESLLPQLPSPADLRPFPREVSVRYDAHRKPIRSLSVDNLGHYLATAGDDGNCFVFEVSTGRVVRRLRLGLYVQCVRFHPRDPNLLAVASESDLYLVNLNLHKTWTAFTEESLGIPDAGAGTGGPVAEQEDDVEDLEAASDEEAAERNEAANNEELEEEKTRLKKSLLKQVVWRRVVGTSASSSSSSVSPKNSAVVPASSTTSATEEAPSTSTSKHTRSQLLWQRGVRVHIEHDGCIKQIEWHKSGNYLSVVSVNCSAKSNQCLIHSLQQKSTVKPFGRMKTGSGISIQQACFHPSKPLFFVATQRSVRIFHLQKQQLTKQLITGAKWISSLSVHPNGDHVIVGTLDRKLMWFDLDLGTKPYKTLKYHDKGLRQVAFYQKVAPHYSDSALAGGASRRSAAEGAEAGEEQKAEIKAAPPAPVSHYPLMCTASDDGTAHIFHARVYNDFVTNPLIVPVKKLHGHKKGVMDCEWHPTHPWIFTCGADGQAFLWV